MIGVVGGGIAGLAAAYRLQERGYEVQVFEASEDVGGLAATYETAGDPIEKFYHHLSKSEETIVDLAADLGLGEALEWRYGADGYYVDGLVHPMDAPWEILAYPKLSLYDTFRLAMLVLDVDVRGGIPSFDTYERLEDFEDVPIEEFVVEHTTRGVYENFFEPLLDAKFGDRKSDVSAAWLLGRVKFRGERDILRGEVLGYFEGGFGRLLDALLDAVGRENVTTGARVRELGFSCDADGPASSGTADGPASSDTADGPASSGTADGTASSGDAGEGPSPSGDGGDDPGTRHVESLTVETADGTERHEVDAAIVATMPNVLEALTGYECAIDFQGTVCSVIAMEDPLTETYWLNVADEAPFGALIEHTNFVPPERYGGEHLLYAVSYVQNTDDPLWGQSDDEVRETWLAGIEDLFPAFDRESVRWVKTARNPRTAPIYERGYLDMVVPYDLGEAVAEGVYYAGMASRAQYPERSLNGGIVAGFECADRIADAD